MTAPDLIRRLQESVVAAQARTDRRPGPSRTAGCDAEEWAADPRPQDAPRQGVVRYVNGAAECSVHGRQDVDEVRAAGGFRQQSPVSWAEGHAFIDGCTVEVTGFPMERSA